jgi:hypothetical protein
VDQSYATLLERNLLGTDSEKAQFAVKVGYVPRELSQDISARLRSVDRDVQFSAIDIIERLDNAPSLAAGGPLSDDYLSDRERAFAGRVASLSRYMDPEAAIKTANEMTDPRARDLMDQYKREFEEFKPKEFEKLAERIIPGWMSKLDGVNGAKLLAHSREMFRTLYLAGTPKDQAEDMVVNRIRKAWGKDDGTGQYMMYPPSKVYRNVYGVNFDPEDMYDDLLERITQTAGGDVNLESITNVELISGDRTAREIQAGVAPTYLVRYYLDDGSVRYLYDPESEAMGRYYYMPKQNPALIEGSPEHLARKEEVRKKMQTFRENNAYDPGQRRLERGAPR